MQNVKIALIFVGLSLDCFIVMMKVGATIRNLNYRKTLLFSLVFGIVNCISVFLAYELAGLINSSQLAFFNKCLACLVLFGIGLFFIVREFFNKKFNERLDESFNIKKCFILALLTTIDTFFVGLSLSLVQTELLMQELMCLIITVLGVYIALRTGYSFGTKYQRTIAIIGGLVLIIFSFDIAVTMIA